MQNNKEKAPPVEQDGANATNNASSNTQPLEAQAREKTAASKVNVRRQAELNEVPMLADLALYGLEQGMSIVIMLNFVDSVHAVAERLHTVNIIHGGWSSFEFRQQLIDAFNAGEEHLIVMTISAGGLDLGISLRSSRSLLVLASATRSKGGQS
jgi:hypothetical protein